MRLAPNKRQEISSATITQTLGLILACSALCALTTYASDPTSWKDPSWWTTRGAVVSPQITTNNGVVTTNYVANNNAVVTQSQLKQFTARAIDELNADLPGGAGTNLNTMASNWASDYASHGYSATNIKPSDYTVMTVGQLKYIAGLVYGKLSAVGYSELTPSWLHPNTNTDNAAATLGQLKRVFDFDLSLPGAGGLTATAGSSGTINLTWTLPSTNNATSWLVEQQNTDGTWTVIATINDPNATSYSVTGLNPDQSYNIQVIGSSPPSVSIPIGVSTSASGSATPGSLLRETWLNTPGDQISDLQAVNNDYPCNPSSRDFPTTFETGSDTRTNLGERFRGYITAPQSGNYTFFISGGGISELLLSTSPSPTNAVVVASVPSATGFRQLNSSSQTSSPIPLVQGHEYYIEVVHKQGTYNPDSLSVGWKLPDNTQEFPIQQTHLAPYTNEGGYMSETWSTAANGSLTWTTFTGTNFATENIAPQGRNLIADALTVTSSLSPGFVRASGWLYPPQTGSYHLTLSSSNAAQINLSTDDSVANKQIVIQSSGGNSSSGALNLTAGSKYYFEVLSQVSQTSDQATLGWQLPDGSSLSAIPRQQVAPNIHLGGPTWEFWTDIGDQALSALLTSKWYPNEPVSRTQQPLFEMQTVTEWSGSRVHGYIQAPQTGNYQFYISGDDESQLLISPTTDPSLATAIAAVPNGNWTLFRSWYQLPSQTSALIPLQAGQWYYIEALEKNGHNGGSVSVAWTLPDGTFEGPIPGWRLNPAPGRLGNLPVVRITSPLAGATFNDSGESVSLASTIQSLDSPITKAELFEDGTKIADLTGPAYQYTFANLSAGDHTLTVKATDDLLETAHDDVAVHVFGSLDSNGNGIPDYEEQTQTFTDPNSTDITGIETTATIDGNSFSSSSSAGDWQETGNGLISKAVQGWVEYTVNISSPDIYRVLVQATPFLNSTPSTLLTLGVQIDGVMTDHVLLPDSSSPNQYAVTYTPYLPAGQHTVRLTWNNYNAGNAVIIKGLVFERLDGAIDPVTGMKQWVENRLARTDSTTVAPPASPVSPVCIEGVTQFAGEVAISSTIAVQHGAGNKWYANVPLSATSPTSTTISYENGARSEQKTFAWVPTDILTVGQITIRKGDSLLLTATGGSTNNVPVTIQVPGQATSNTDSVTPVPRQFNQAGTFNVTASYFGDLPDRGTYDPVTGFQGTLVVTVVDANFDGNALAWTDRPRVWNCPDIPANVTVEADPSIQFSKTTIQPATGSQFSALTHVAADTYVVARLFPGGPILANAAVRGFWLKSSDEAYLSTVETFPDGSVEVEMDIVVSLVTSDESIVLQTDTPQALFSDGTITKTLTAADFDSHNTAKVFFIIDNSQSSICHTLTVYQAGAYVGTR